MPTITVDGEEIDGFPDKIYQAIKKSREKATMEAVGNLSEEAPYDHGKLRGSFNAKRINDLQSQVISSANYAIVVSEGSDPYEIYPDAAEVLVFEWPEGPADIKTEGDLVFLKKVEHPGIEGDGYINRAAEQVKERADTFVQQALKEVGLI